MPKPLLSSDLQEKAQSYQKQGKTVSYLAIDGHVAGYVVIGDKIKESSKKAIKSLQGKGIDVIMLTGDNHDTAQAVASELNLTDFRAGMLPEDKMKAVEQLQDKGKVVAMAGDGINDAPALAKSDVGIAMGTGTDVAIESAAITLVKGDLHGIVKARNLSDKVMGNIKQNLFFALVYNTLGVPIAAGVLYPFFGILLSPMIAAAAMSFSSVSVIANALTVKKCQDKLMAIQIALMVLLIRGLNVLRYRKKNESFKIYMMIKNMIYLAVAVIAGFLVGYLIFGTAPVEDTSAVHEHGTEVKTETMWTCSMHPQIHATPTGQMPHLRHGIDSS